MKVLVTGSQGMLGQALIRSLSTREVAVEGADIRSKDNAVDISNDKDIMNLITRIKPDIVIHAAAYTDVDGCEDNPEKAHLINGEGAKFVATACNNTNSLLIYISTDFIFDGTKTTPYTEEDKPNPINVYGKSKLAGENFVKDILSTYLIIRTSWLFGEGGRNFVDSIISLAEAGKNLKVVDDQKGSPTYTVDLAEAITELLLTPYTLYLTPLNITNTGSCTWYEFAKEILKAKGIKEVSLNSLTSSELNRPAKRPKMSILDNSKFEKLYGKSLPAWQDALQRYLNRDVGVVS